LVSRTTLDLPEPTDLGFEVLEQATSETDTSSRRIDPHPFDLGCGRIDELNRSATDDLVAGAGDDEDAARWPEAERSIVERGVGVEALGEAPGELVEVLRHRPTGLLGRHVDRRERDLVHAGHGTCGTFTRWTTKRWQSWATPTWHMSGRPSDGMPGSKSATPNR
jgi:hypothetical protein